MKLLWVWISAIILLVGCSSTPAKNSNTTSVKDPEKALNLYVQIAYEHLRRNKFPEARYAINRALEVSDQHWPTYLGLAKINEGEKEFATAEVNYKKASELGGGLEVDFHYGAFLFNQGKYEAACAKFRSVVLDQNYERRSNAYTALARCENKLGNNQAAVDAYNKAILLDKNNSEAYLALASWYQQEKNFPLAWQYFQGFAKLANQGRAGYSAGSLLVGIRLAAMNKAFDQRDKFVAMLDTNFPNSPEYREYHQGR